MKACFRTRFFSVVLFVAGCAFAACDVTSAYATDQAESDPHSMPVPGAAPVDAGAYTSFNNLTRRVSRLWRPACDVPGAKQVRVSIGFTLSPNGLISQGPDWKNPRPDEIWVAGADRAKAAVIQGQPYDGLPDQIYNVPIVIMFDATKACQ